jgi:hypothetical protein
MLYKLALSQIGCHLLDPGQVQVQLLVLVGCAA